MRTQKIKFESFNPCVCKFKSKLGYCSVIKTHDQVCHFDTITQVCNIGIWDEDIIEQMARVLYETNPYVYMEYPASDYPAPISEEWDGALEECKKRARMQAVEVYEKVLQKMGKQ